jgi:hypothetical protein
MALLLHWFTTFFNDDAQNRLGFGCTRQHSRMQVNVREFTASLQPLLMKCV